MNLRRLFLVLTLILVLGLTACGGEDKESDRDTINAGDNKDKNQTDKSEDTNGSGETTGETGEETSDGTTGNKAEDITLTEDSVRATLSEALTLLVEGKGAEAASHAPSFTPEEWLQDTRYVRTEEIELKSATANEIQILQYVGVEEIKEIYEKTSLSRHFESFDDLNGVESLAVIRYTYNYETTDGESGTDTAEEGSDFMMAYENGEWKYVFHDSVPDSIAEYNLRQHLDEKIVETYKVTGVEHYEKGEPVLQSWEDFAAMEGLGAEAWTLEFSLVDTPIVIDEETRTKLKGVIKGEGDSYERGYSVGYVDMYRVSAYCGYDKDANVFCGYNVDYRSEIDLLKGTFRLKIEKWEDRELFSYTLVFEKRNTEDH